MLFLDLVILLVIALLNVVQGRQFLDEVLQLLDLLGLLLAQVAKMFDFLAQVGVDSILICYQLLAPTELLLLELSDLGLEVFDGYGRSRCTEILEYFVAFAQYFQLLLEQSVFDDKAVVVLSWWWWYHWFL